MYSSGSEGGGERPQSDEARAQLLLRAEEPGCDRQVLALRRHESDATGTADVYGIKLKVTL